MWDRDGLGDEMLAVREMVHRFAAEVMRPAAAALDRLADPADVIAPHSVLWQVFDRYRELGIGDPSHYDPSLSPADRALLHAVVLEELSWGDVGLAISLGLCDTIAPWALGFGRQEAWEFFRERRDIGCLALTEPEHGSDAVGFTEPFFTDARVRPQCRARREGSEYVIEGQKAAWVSNGTIATAAALFCTLEGSRNGLAGGAAFLVPLELPGVGRGKPLDKLGQRTLNQGEIFFDGVRVPEAFRLIEGPEAYGRVWEAVLKIANSAMGQQLVGLGRAALEHAIDHAKTRVQGGCPIFEHAGVKQRLFSMFRKVEAARSLARRVAVAAACTDLGFAQAAASKVFCTQVAFEVASDAVQIFGGLGLCREAPVEKLFRDARMALIEDGENDFLGLMAASQL